jgi:phospholipid/cholesterol/gamma-HCH transport system substrate-binding protein
VSALRRMGLKARIAVGLVLLAAASLLVTAVGAKKDSSGSYEVRAIFDNATFIIPGEQVKVAGVPVGAVTALDVTPQKKAAITLNITDSKFKDFRKDAHCTIRPESLIGERFVECAPTVPNDTGAPSSPPLKKIPDGQPGAGEYLLPVTQTSTPVDVDLIADSLRLPYRQRLTLIINELGTGLAANGDELRDVIRRANPTLGELDKVLAILASENRTLAQIQRDSNIAIAPLARDRTQVADFITRAAEVASATADRRGDLERNLELLPTFLNELRQTAPRINGLADQAIPVLQDLHAHAPAINNLIGNVGPFARAALPATKALGQAAKVGGPALVKALPVTRQIRDLAVALKPVAADAANLLTSLQKTGGVERALDFIFYQSMAINGEDKVGHYLRAGLITNANLSGCSTYAGGTANGQNVLPAPGCSAKFSDTTPATTATARQDLQTPAATESTDPSLSAAQEILRQSSARMLDGKGAISEKKAAKIYIGKLRQAQGAPPTVDPNASKASQAKQTTALLQYLTGTGK